MVSRTSFPPKFIVPVCKVNLHRKFMVEVRFHIFIIPVCNRKRNLKFMFEVRNHISENDSCLYKYVFTKRSVESVAM